MGRIEHMPVISRPYTPLERNTEALRTRFSGHSWDIDNTDGFETSTDHPLLTSLTVMETLEQIQTLVRRQAKDTVATRQLKDLEFLSRTIFNTSGLRNAFAKNTATSPFPLNHTQQEQIDRWAAQYKKPTSLQARLAVFNPQPILSALETMHQVESLLTWDLETGKLPGAELENRARQLATLMMVRHEMLQSASLKRLFQINRFFGGKQAAQLTDALQLMKRVENIPTSLVKDTLMSTFRAHIAWREAKGLNDFSHLAPALQQLVDLKIQQAKLAGATDENLYDYMLQDFEPGMTTKELDRLFLPLRRKLPRVVRRLQQLEQPPPKSPFGGHLFDPSEQRAVAESIVTELGFDLDKGTLIEDPDLHPFYMAAGGSDDVRTAIRAYPHDPTRAILTALHESVGHGRLEQNLPKKPWPHSKVHSLGLHESQALLSENELGRTLAFWQRFLPVLQKQWPEKLKGVTAEQLYEHVNHAKPSLIRTDADELTYNLHVLLRYEIEKALFAPPDERIQVADVPRLWAEKMEKYIGMTPDHDRHGPLQDVHWSAGMFGYFPSYMLGTLYSANLMKAAERDIPGLKTHMADGDFRPLQQWLRARVHQNGATPNASTMVEAIADHRLDGEVLFDRIRAKLTGLYPPSLFEFNVRNGSADGKRVAFQRKDIHTYAPNTNRPLKLCQWTSEQSKQDDFVFVTVPGLGATTELANPFVSRFIKDHDLIYGIDTYAFGKSRDRYELRNHRDLVDELKDTLEWIKAKHPDRKIVMLATSQGALSSIFVAAENPELVHANIWVAPALGISGKTFTPAFILKSLGYYALGVIPGITPKTASIPYAVGEKGKPPPAWIQEVVKDVSTLTKPTLLKLLRMTQVGRYQKIPRITQPTLMILPEQDQIVSLPAMKKAGQTLMRKNGADKTKLVTIPDSNHYVMVDPHKVPEVVDAVSQWIETSV